MIDTVNIWIEIMQYNDRKAMAITNLVETTWLVRYPWPVEITYDPWVEFFGHEFKNILIEQEYGIDMKPDSSGNPQANETIERIHQVIGNLLRSYTIQETYVDNSDPCMGILAIAAFVVRSTYHRTKHKSPGQLFFGRDMILPIEHIGNWRYIRQRKQS